MHGLFACYVVHLLVRPAVKESMHLLILVASCWEILILKYDDGRGVHAFC